MNKFPSQLELPIRVSKTLASGFVFTIWPLAWLTVGIAIVIGAFGDGRYQRIARAAGEKSYGLVVHCGRRPSMSKDADTIGDLYLKSYARHSHP